MKILFISRINPFLSNGGAFATRAYLDAFSEISEKCTALICDNAVIPKDYNSSVDFIPVPDRKLKDKIIFPITKITHRFIPFIYSLAKKNNKYAGYDTIVINGSVIAGSMVDYFKSIGKKVITIHHNVEHFYHKDNRTIDSFGGHLFYIVDKHERNALVKSDLNLSISQADIAQLKSFYSLGHLDTIKYIGCFEYKDRVQNHTNSKGIVNDKQLIITGSLCDIQTKNCIDNFLKFYYPAVHEKYPDYRLIIAGRNPDETTVSLCKQNGINLVVNPDNIDILVNSSAIYLCPTSLGSGLKLRIMDALRNGIPVLTHAVSARGYESFFDKSYFKVYSTLSEFLLNFEQLSQLQNTAEEILKDYNKEFSYAAGVKRLKSIMEGYNYI